jgi:hypothetical protein
LLLLHGAKKKNDNNVSTAQNQLAGRSIFIYETSTYSRPMDASTSPNFDSPWMEIMLMSVAPPPGTAQKSHIASLHSHDSSYPKLMSREGSSILVPSPAPSTSTSSSNLVRFLLRERLRYDFSSPIPAPPPLPLPVLLSS